MTVTWLQDRIAIKRISFNKKALLRKALEQSPFNFSNVELDLIQFTATDKNGVAISGLYTPYSEPNTPFSPDVIYKIGLYT